MKKSQGLILLSLLAFTTTFVACGDVNQKGGKAKSMAAEKDARDKAKLAEAQKIKDAQGNACEDLRNNKYLPQKQADSKFLALQLKLLDQAAQIQKIGLRSAMKNEKLEQQSIFEVLASSMKTVINSDGTRKPIDERDKNCTGLTKFVFQVVQFTEQDVKASALAITSTDAKATDASQTADPKAAGKLTVPGKLPVVVDFYKTDCNDDVQSMHAKFSYKDPLTMKIEIIQKNVLENHVWNWLDKKEMITCELEFNIGGRLKKLYCNNLAQELQEDAGIKFSKFNYDVERKTAPLQLAGELLHTKEAARKFCPDTNAICNVNVDAKTIKLEEFCIYAKAGAKTDAKADPKADSTVDSNADPETRFLKAEKKNEQKQDS